MKDCPASEYKDNRHIWFGTGPSPVKHLALRYCPRCGRVEVEQLTDQGSQAGDVWETIAVGQMK